MNRVSSTKTHLHRTEFKHLIGKPGHPLMCCHHCECGSIYLDNLEILSFPKWHKSTCTWRNNA